MTHDYRAIVEVILDAYALSLDGYHGIHHWARVWENGLQIASANGADVEVVRLFALFHDARRVNEDIDPDHGLRGGDLAHALRGSLVQLDDTRFDLLYEACRLHTDGHTAGDPTHLACWDADRLDLGRVGITPKPERLCTDAARILIPWAQQRAERDHQARRVLRLWGQ